MTERTPLPWYLQPFNLMLVVAALSVARLATGMNIGLVEDEAYYRLWGLYPALGYYDHPPMVGWWIWLGQSLVGDTALGVRLISILSAAIGSVFLWRTAVLLFDERVAGWSVLLLNASILVGVGSLISTPDAPSVLFWGMALWALAELHHSQNPYWWLVVGVCAGFGLLSKYSVLFLGVGIVLWLLWVPQNRRHFLTWQLWAGGALAVLVFSPVLIWNANHEWISFTKQFGRVVAREYTLKYIGEYVGAVAGLLNPLIFILAVAGAVPLFKGFMRKDSVGSLLLLTILPFLVYLTLHSFHSRVQGNWPAPLYPTFALFAAFAIARASAKRAAWHEKLAFGALGLGFIAAFLVYIHALYPLYDGLGRKDPTHQLRGWQEIGAAVEELALASDAEWVITSSYGMTGQLSNALKRSGLGVYQFNERLRYAMIPEGLQEPKGERLLYVVEERRDRSSELEKYFEKVERLTEIPRKTGSARIEGIRIYLLEHPEDTGGFVPPPLKNE
ncbi:glycosyltransferase family 39 protein [Pseudovibrio exalbescens]|uniref:glycosyltransferase family 39 protein n=1 Tax=Pseudovibrio exalbescens TaxID=197461 RepID=UPI002365CD42|nr:glycosyltransferase family 39 protein [Pseudovibrio exalbescens]MDD7911365.1 glycosyltransferase family 39 protein [Pseudovibrio exalbescens]